MFWEEGKFFFFYSDTGFAQLQRFTFYWISVVADEGGEVCNSHFPLQSSHPVNKTWIYDLLFINSRTASKLTKSERVKKCFYVVSWTHAWVDSSELQAICANFSTPSGKNQGPAMLLPKPSN